MCLIALSIGLSERFPLVVAANRDEFFERPAAPLGWWGVPPILAGRDLQAGGTWLGLSAAGRIAMLTNIRRPGSQREQAPSRGAIVPMWLQTEQLADSFCAQLAEAGYNPFNCIAADLARGECFHASSEHPAPQHLAAGQYGVSNALLDTPWPKVLRLKARLHDALALASAHAGSTQELAASMLAALADHEQVPVHQLPDTGVGAEWERLLSPAFIHAPQRGYGTRCSTVLITERVNGRAITHLIEQGFTPQGAAAERRELRLEDWPPVPIALPARSAERL
jgi:uncharacterized protein with NRDE domain